jgi:hypothetical protein
MEDDGINGRKVGPVGGSWSQWEEWYQWEEGETYGRKMGPMGRR